MDELDAVPDGATVIFSAHGVARAVRAEAENRGLRVFDATCPLVTKVHMEVARHRQNGTECVLIGHAGHPRSRGHHGAGERRDLSDRAREDVARLQIRDPENLAYVTQTTPFHG